MASTDIKDTGKYEADIVIIGSGGGLAAAVTAAETGASSWGYKQYATATWSGGGGLGTTGYGPVLASASFDTSMAAGSTLSLTITDSATATRGRRSSTSVPRAGALRTLMSPPCSRTIR